MESFPQTIGLSGEEARRIINGVDANLTVHIVPEGSMVTMDFRTDRVRVFVDEGGIVRSAPNVG